LQLGSDQLDEFQAEVLKASARPEVQAAVESVYCALQDQIDLRRPICVTSGRCCQFEEFGHRLFVTTLEMAAFLANMTAADRAALAGGNGSGCPFQHSKLCTVHSIRPFGCRVFFCDATSTDWQQQQYEFFHREFRRLHESLGVRYFYVEWRQALAAGLSKEVQTLK
jgi:Fe-S-cluster containining protein